MSDRSFKLVYAFFFVFVSVYLILRGITIPLVHDEAETFFIYFVNGHFLPYQGWISANNHFLNSFLGHISFKMFGTEEWSIRLPNLLFIPIYGFYLFKLSAIIKNNILRLILLLTLICTPFFIDFFALARGYGMAMALLMAYLFHFTSYLRNKSFKSFLYTQVLGLMCLLASLTTFYIFLIILLFLCIDIALDIKSGILKNGIKKILALSVFQFIPALFFTRYIIHLGSINELVVGTLDGIYVETIAPLVYWLTGTESILMVLFFIGVFTLMFLQMLLKILKDKTINIVLDPYQVFCLLLVISIVLISFNGYILKIPFPRDRAAMFLFPLFIFSIVIGLDQLKFSSIYKVALSSILLFFPIDMILSLNLTHSHYWKTKRIDPEYYDYIYDHSGGNVVTIGSLSLRESIWYHQIFKHQHRLNPLFIHDPSTDISTDFKIQPADINSNILETYDLILEDKISGNNLYERKQKLTKNKITSGPLITFKGHAMYHEILNHQIKNEFYQDLYLLELDFNIQAIKVPIEFSLILNLKDEQGQSIKEQSIRLSRLKYNWDEREPYKLVFTLGMLPKNISSIGAFIYNNNEVGYELSGGSYKIYTLVDD